MPWFHPHSKKSHWQELDQGNKQLLLMCTHSVHFTLPSKPIAFVCSNSKCIKPEEEPVKNAACTGTGSLRLDVLGHCRSWGAKGAVVGGLSKGESRMHVTLEENFLCSAVCGPKRADFWELQSDRVLNLKAGGMSLGGTSGVRQEHPQGTISSPVLRRRSMLMVFLDRHYSGTHMLSCLTHSTLAPGGYCFLILESLNIHCTCPFWMEMLFNDV